MRFAMFPLHLCKVLRLPRKIDARSYEVLHLSRKIISANLKIWYSKMHPSQEMSALTSEHLWWTCLLYCTCHAKCIFEDPLQMPHACHRFWKCCKTLAFCSLLTRCTIFCGLPRKTTSQPPKVARTCSVLYILTSKCAWRHNSVHFFDIATSKSDPKLVCFVHFDLEMCFAPQRRALFRHRNFQKWSEPGVFCTFWLWNVLRATKACTFLTSQLPKVLREWCVLYILTSNRASRHNSVQLFISHLASWLRTRSFSELTFRPSGATNHWKNRVFRDFPTFSHICILFSALLSSNLSLLSASALLCFSSVHIVGRLLLNFLR